MSIGAAKGSAGRPQQRSHDVYRYPAPLKGVDVRKSIGSEDPLFCPYTFNLVPYEAGMKVREGYREWQVGVTGFVTNSINTIIPYDSAFEGDSGDRLFSVTTSGIWDTTDYDTAPVQKLVFASGANNAGFGTYAHYVTDAGETILFYADAENGLFQYTPLTDTWAQATGINGPTITDVKFIVAHKQRIWLIEENSTAAWYLGIGSPSGQATEFYFGSKFRHGGTLEGLFSWTVDGGAGVDDILVAVSHAGDIVVYTGSDPAESDWSERGTYFIGEIPNTPRFGTEQGGELFLLSAFGVISMNDLLQGVDSAALQADVEGGATMAIKIAGLIRASMSESIEMTGWAINPIPSEGGILISIPTIGAAAPIQYYYNIALQSWGIWRNVPMVCFENFQDSVVFGTADGRVCKMDVPTDNKKLGILLTGDPIVFSILTSFQALGTPAIYKRPKLLRPDFVAQQPVQSSSLARYDFNIAEGQDFQLVPPVTFPVGAWDQNNWEESIWGSEQGQAFPTIGGAWGYGRYIAIATKGSTTTSTRLIGWDMVFDTGGPMI